MGNLHQLSSKRPQMELLTEEQQAVLEGYTGLSSIQNGAKLEEGMISPLLVEFALKRVERGDYDLIELRRAWADGLSAYLRLMDVNHEIRSEIAGSGVAVDERVVSSREQRLRTLLRDLKSGAEIPYMNCVIIPACESFGEMEKN
ncbi:hypothetical protein CVV38_00510 [Candidatus Peregrinibacteria bacterium HGW-Peregrinibacteria-1]|nr:MAG: hypothetical protein CVV38_00510 [Candidatus Peregrinibacteria bacterium HGW-Peregrinibacteria-1]